MNLFSGKHIDVVYGREKNPLISSLIGWMIWIDKIYRYVNEYGDNEHLTHLISSQSDIYLGVILLKYETVNSSLWPCWQAENQHPPLSLSINLTWPIYLFTYLPISLPTYLPLYLPIYAYQKKNTKKATRTKIPFEPCTIFFPQWTYLSRVE